MAKSLIASASVAIGEQGGDVLLDRALLEQSAKVSARFERSPMTMREGYRLSYSAWPSRRNSGENIRLSQLNCARGLDGVADGNGGLDDHHRLRIDGHDILNHGLDRRVLK